MHIHLPRPGGGTIAAGNRIRPQVAGVPAGVLASPRVYDSRSFLSYGDAECGTSLSLLTSRFVNLFRIRFGSLKPLVFTLIIVASSFCLCSPKVLRKSPLSLCILEVFVYQIPLFFPSVFHRRHEGSRGAQTLFFLQTVNLESSKTCCSPLRGNQENTTEFRQVFIICFIRFSFFRAS